MTTAFGPQWHGMTASAVCSVSLNPLLVMVSVARGSVMHAMVTASHVFSINVLGAEDEAVARIFADSSRCRQTQFVGLVTAPGVTGCPILLDAIAYVEARVWAMYDGGDHSLVVGEVAAMGILNPRRPLLFNCGRYTSVELVAVEHRLSVQTQDAELSIP